MHEIEHRYILGWFVISFGNTQHDDPYIFSQVETGRTDEISDILDKQQISFVYIEFGESRLHHTSVEMAPALSVELNNLNTRVLQAPGIQVGIQVSLYHGTVDSGGDVFNRALQQCGLARTG